MTIRIRVMALLCTYLFNASLFAQCISQGANGGSTFTNNTGTGTVAWSNTGNAALSDDNTASAGKLLALFSSAKTNYLVVENIGFSIPPTATICGIQVQVERRAGGIAIGSSVTDHHIHIVKNGIIAGTDHAAGGNWPATDGYTSYGNNLDTWGATWLPADINAADFGIAIAASLNAGIAGLFQTAHIDHVRITVYYLPAIILPLKLESFQVTSTKHRNMLNWTATVDKDAGWFVPQRSADNIEWSTLSVIPASPQQQRYSYTDEHPPVETQYYRLALRNNDGTHTYSSILTVRERNDNRITIYPNPATEWIMITADKNIRCIVIRDLQGKLVRSIRVKPGTRKYEVSLTGLPHGQYLLNVDGKIFKLQV